MPHTRARLHDQHLHPSPPTLSETPRCTPSPPPRAYTARGTRCTPQTSTSCPHRPPPPAT
eukprot:1811217-Rhodomonas_salina.1